MKKGLALIIASVFVISASADLTQFAWSGGTLADENGGVIPYGQATVFTILDTDSTPDFLSFVIGGGYVRSYFDMISTYSANQTVGPPFGPQNLLATGNIDGDGSVAGMYAYAIVVEGIYSSLHGISLGTPIGISSTAHLITDLQPDPGQPPATKQIFNPGDVQINIIDLVPEPSVVGLMGVASVAMFLTRRKTHR